MVLVSLLFVRMASIRSVEVHCVGLQTCTYCGFISFAITAAAGFHCPAPKQ